jgi:hypothetical protein
MTEMELQAYNAGYQAYPDRDCPYETETVLWRAWWSGYTQCDWDSAYWTD